jgi:soluble lytic murein transglycosylase-like protein
MRKLTVLAAAAAVGVTTFAARAEDSALYTIEQAAIETAIRTEASKERADQEDATATKMAVLASVSTIADVESLKDAVAEGARAKSKELAAAIAAKKAPAGRFGTIIHRYAATYGVPVTLAKAVIQVESNYRPDARGSAGEIGLMQIKPATARLMGYDGSNDGLFHPETNIKFGMKYLAKAHKLGGGTICGTILKYNAGHAAKRMNPVSSAYCSKVKRHLAGI